MAVRSGEGPRGIRRPGRPSVLPPEDGGSAAAGMRISSIRTIAEVPSSRDERWRWLTEVIASPNRALISTRTPQEHWYKATVASPSYGI